ncbi:hypothetical protein M9H77_18581 [Catharanthus roseus]|uniref:Uncharacterized protein n=1 Tax=Catharanthus roseus TaxID=4058 RepID=A0ACC0B851_CATRO|nr:hypothetical protein M9H77_18581 [Catharanthus roseus]
MLCIEELSINDVMKMTLDSVEYVDGFYMMYSRVQRSAMHSNFQVYGYRAYAVDSQSLHFETVDMLGETVLIHQVSHLNVAYSPSAWIITSSSFEHGVMASYLGPFSPVSILNLAVILQTSRSAFSSYQTSMARTTRTVLVLDDDDDNDNEKLTDKEANHQGIEGGTRNRGSGESDAAKCDSEKGNVEGYVKNKI